MTNQYDKKATGALINLRMIEKGFETKDFASEFNVTSQAVGKWRRGDAIPSADILLGVAAKLDLSIDELLAGEPQSVGNKAEWRLNEKIDSLSLSTGSSLCILVGLMMMFVSMYGVFSLNLLAGNDVKQSIGYITWLIVAFVCALGGLYLVLSGLKKAKDSDSR